MAEDDAWAEEDYLQYLRAERERYAWVMRTYGHMSTAQAQEAATRRYPYEPPDTPLRGLIFHDEAWHWAMLAVHGEGYPVRHPDLREPPAAYQALD